MGVHQVWIHLKPSKWKAENLSVSDFQELNLSVVCKISTLQCRTHTWMFTARADLGSYPCIITGMRRLTLYDFALLIKWVPPSLQMRIYYDLTT